MPAKKVLQYKCDRCPRIWYEDENKPEVKLNLELAAEIDGQLTAVKFECLCESCKKTVSALVTALKREPKKVSAERGARKKKSSQSAEPAGKGEPSPAGSNVTELKPPAGAEDVPPTPKSSSPSVPPPASSTAASGGVGSGSRPALSSQSHPTRR